MSQKAVQELLDVDDPVGSLLQVVLKYEAIPEQAPNPTTRRGPADREKPVAPVQYFFQVPSVRMAACAALDRASQRIAPLMATSGEMTETQARVAAKRPGVRLLRRAGTVVPRWRHPLDREIGRGRPAATPQYLVKARRTGQLRFRHVPKLRGAYSSSPSYEPCSLTPGSAGRDVFTRHCGGSARTRSRRDRRSRTFSWCRRSSRSAPGRGGSRRRRERSHGRFLGAAEVHTFLRKARQACGRTTSWSPSGCFESRTATSPGRLRATSTQLPLWPL